MQVVSHIPGRIRILSEYLKNEEHVKTYIDSMSDHEWVISVSNDLRIGSVIILYDREAMASKQAEITLKNLFILSIKPPVLNTGKKKQKRGKNLKKGTLKKPVAKGNYSYKKAVLHGAMTVALGSTLFFSYYWNKKLHVASGIAMSAIMVYHTYTNRHLLYQPARVIR